MQARHAGRPRGDKGNTQPLHDALKASRHAGRNDDQDGRGGA